MAQNARATEWSGLLESTRLALSTLHLEDLEKLAARAEQMLDAASMRDSVRPRIDPGERRKIHEGHRLLGSLLAATDKNLDILRRLHGSPGRNGASGLDSRWVR